MKEVTITVSPRCYVSISPYGGPYVHVGEVSEIHVTKEGVWAFCKMWYAKDGTNRVADAAFDIQRVNFIDKLEFLEVSSKYQTVSAEKDISFLESLVGELKYLHEFIATGFSSCCELDFCMRLLRELEVKITQYFVAR